MLNQSNLEGASEQAKKYSKVADLSELRVQYAPDYSSGSQPEAARRGMMAYGKSSAIDNLSSMAMAMPAPGASLASHDEAYGVASGEIDYTQSERLVQKVLNRKK